MKKLIALLAIVGALAVVNVQGAEQAPAPKHKGPPPMSEENKKAYQELVAKYDANKNGRLEKEEAEKATPEDKKKLKEIRESTVRANKQKQ